MPDGNTLLTVIVGIVTAIVTVLQKGKASKEEVNGKADQKELDDVKKRLEAAEESEKKFQKLSKDWQQAAEDVAAQFEGYRRSHVAQATEWAMQREQMDYQITRLRKSDDDRREEMEDLSKAHAACLERDKDFRREVDVLKRKINDFAVGGNGGSGL